MKVGDEAMARRWWQAVDNRERSTSFIALVSHCRRWDAGFRRLSLSTVVQPGINLVKCSVLPGESRGLSVKAAESSAIVRISLRDRTHGVVMSRLPRSRQR